MDNSEFAKLIDKLDEMKPAQLLRVLADIMEEEERRNGIPQEVMLSDIADFAMAYGKKLGLQERGSDARH